MAISAITSFKVGGSNANYTEGSLRENFEDFITLISPQKTPFLSMIGTMPADGPNIEWQTDRLADPDRTARDAGVELSDLTAESYTAKLLHNLTEVTARRVDVDLTTIKSRSAGAADWFDYEIDKAQLALRRDIESKILYYDVDTASNADDIVASNSTNTRKMAGFAAYAGIWNMLDADGTPQFVNAAGTTSNVGNGSLVPNGTAFSVLADTNVAFGDKVVQLDEAPTTVSLTESHLTSSFEVLSENGGDLNTLMTPTGLKPAVRKIYVSNGAVAERRADNMTAKLNVSVDMIMTDFNQDVALVPNYMMTSFAGDASQCLYGFDSNKMMRGILQEYALREDGGAHRGIKAQMDCEETFIAKDPSSMLVIANAKV